MATETLIVPNDRTPLDLLLWRRYGREVPGLLEQTLALPENRGLAALGPFPPAGTAITVVAPAPAAKANRPVVSLYD